MTLTSEDIQMVILKAARIALADAELFDEIAEENGLTDGQLQKIVDLIHKQTEEK